MLDRFAFMYESCDIPPGVTVAQWRRLDFSPSSWLPAAGTSPGTDDVPEVCGGQPEVQRRRRFPHPFVGWRAR